MYIRLRFQYELMLRNSGEKVRIARCKDVKFLHLQMQNVKIIIIMLRLLRNNAKNKNQKCVKSKQLATKKIYSKESELQEKCIV